MSQGLMLVQISSKGKERVSAGDGDETEATGSAQFDTRRLWHSRTVQQNPRYKNNSLLEECCMILDYLTTQNLESNRFLSVLEIPGKRDICSLSNVHK